jgi:hypothetical protein
MHLLVQHVIQEHVTLSGHDSNASLLSYNFHGVENVSQCLLKYAKV